LFFAHCTSIIAFFSIKKNLSPMGNKISDDRLADEAKKMLIIPVSFSNSLILIYDWSLDIRFREKRLHK